MVFVYGFFFIQIIIRTLVQLKTITYFLEKHNNAYNNVHCTFKLQLLSKQGGFPLRGFPSRLDYYYYLSSVILSDGWRIKVNEIVGQHYVPGRDLRDWLMTIYWRPPVIHQWQMINSPPSPKYILRMHKLYIYIYTHTHTHVCVKFIR